MTENRESLFQIKSAGFKDSDVKFQISLRLDFGRAQCSERMNKIKALGIDPSNNAIAVVHEFPNEAAATAFVAKATEMKTMLAPQIGKPAELLESIKAEGNKAVVTLRFPPEAAAPLGILEAVAGSMGDFADKHQFAEFRFANSRSLKDICTDQSASPIALAVETLCVKLVLSLQKDLPIKIADFVSQMAPESEKPHVALAGRAFAAFHHFKLEMDLKEPTEAMKQIAKNEAAMGLMSVAQMAVGMASQFGCMDVVKNGGSQTTATLCLTPILSFEFTLFAPTVVETLEKLSTPQA